MIKKKIASVSLLLLSLGLTFVALEIATRLLAGAPWPEKMPLVRVQPDEDLGWRMVPDDFHYTYEHPVQLNSLGFRGPEVERKASGEYRVLAVGDSHVYGQGLADDELVSFWMERTLEGATTDCTVRVFNLGSRAYSLNQELGVLEKFAADLQPDHVVLFPYINDFTEVDIEDNYYTYMGTDWFMLDISAKDEGPALFEWRVRQLLRRSALMSWVNDRVAALMTSGHLEQRILKGELSGANGDELADALHSLGRIDDWAKRQGVTLDLAVIPVAAQLVTEFPNNQYQTTFRRFARERDLRYIDLLTPLRDHYLEQGRLPLIPYDGHYNADAQRVMGQVVGTTIRQSLAGCSGSPLGEGGGANEVGGVQ